MVEKAGGDLEVSWDEETGVPRFLSGRIPTPPGPGPEGIARAFFHEYKGLYSMRDPEGELALMKVAHDRIGMDHVRFQQVYQGLPVFGAQMITHLRGKEITSVNGEYIPRIEVSVEPALSGEEAIQIARGDLGDEEAVLSEEELGIYHDGETAHLAWRLELSSSDPLGRWVHFVDAHDGQIVLKFNTIDTAKRILTYDANNGTTLPGTLVCDSDTDPTCIAGDTVEQDTHNNASDVYDYYYNTFSRDSYDGAGATLTSTVHYGVAYNNAFWNGTQTVYGDGDGTTFSPLGQDLDIVTHEWTHAVTQYTANLWYIHQSGALNESYSDVFAAMNDTDGNEWWMGEASYTPGTPGDALRYMDNPPLGNQPDHWDEYLYLPVEVDNGGVHINSGIPNNAAYLIAAGGTHPDSLISVTGIGRTKTEQIYYQTLTQYLTPTSRFLDAAYASRQACQSLIGSYGITSSNCDSVQNGFAAVGLGHEVIPGLDNYIYLPLVMKNYGYVCTGSGTQLLQNTGFESGPVNWVQSRSGIIQNAWTFNASTWNAWFGQFYNNADDRLYQSVHVPGGGIGSAQLIFDLLVGTDETVAYPYDRFYVELQDNTGTPFSSVWVASNTWDVDGAGGYWWIYNNVTVTWYEFEPYTDQVIRVFFQATTDESLPTNFAIDDVTFKVYCGYEAPSDYIPATPMEPVVKVESVKPISPISPELMELRE